MLGQVFSAFLPAPKVLEQVFSEALPQGHEAALVQNLAASAPLEEFELFNATVWERPLGGARE